MKRANQRWTLLFEIVHPSLKVVIDYGMTPQLYLLSAYDCENGQEIQSQELESLGFDRPIFAKKTEEIDHQLGSVHEGYVAVFDDGSRLKIKQAWYEYALQSQIAARN